MAAITKQQADAYDQMIDAAAALADLIQDSGIEMDEYALETLTIFLAGRAPEIRSILKKCDHRWP